MSRCKKDEVWTSYVNDQYDGRFIIKMIAPSGAFTGTHDGDYIQGLCKGGTISYTRYGTRRSYYGGRYSGNDNLRGVRHRLPMFSKRKQIRDDDDWVGTHTTLASRRKTAARKSGETKARATAGRKR